MATATLERSAATSTAPIINLTPWKLGSHRQLMEDLSDPAYRHLIQTISSCIQRFYDLDVSKVHMSGSVDDFGCSDGWVQIVLMRDGEYWRGFRQIGTGLQGQIRIEADGDIADIVKCDMEGWARATWNLACKRPESAPCTVDILVDLDGRMEMEVFACG